MLKSQEIQLAQSKRRERMAEHLFQTADFPEAHVSARYDVTAYDALAVGDSVEQALRIEQVVVPPRVEPGRHQKCRRQIGQTLVLQRLEVFTSVTTLLALLSRYFLGGEVIQPFAKTMLIGVLVGTYSSIFIASPLLLFLEQRYGKGPAKPKGPGVNKAVV